MSGYVFYPILVLSTTLIAYQDFKDRLVSLWVLIVYFITITVYTYTTGGWSMLLENGIGVLAYFGICFSVLFVYYFVKEKKLPKIVDDKIGMADLLIFLAIGISLPLFQLILFFTIGFTLAALIALLVLKDKKSVPLAGILVIAYLIFSVFKGTFVILG